MTQTPVPITYGTGQASVAGDIASGALYQQIKVVDGTIGSNTALIVNADGTANVRISGSVATAGGTFTGSVSGTVGASIIGIAPVFIVGGSIAGTFTTPNQSVSGTVGASILGAVPVQLSNSSIITVAQGSIAAVIVGGSIAASFTPPVNQSVSGTVGASVIGAVPVVGSPTGSPVPAQAFYIAGNNGGFLSPITTVLNQADGVTLAGGVAVGPWVYNGTSWDRLRGDSSIGAVVSTARSSVITVAQGSIATVIIGGSIAASFTPPVNQSVSGTVGASIIGAVPIQLSNSSVITVWQNSSIIAVPTGNQSVSGAVSISNFPTTQNVSGSVVATQGTNPWIITGSVQGSFTPAANQSVSGTVGASVIGLTPVSVSNFPTNQNVSGSVVSFQGTNPWVITSSIAGGIFPISGSVAATVTNFPTSQNVSGSVVAFQGTSPWAVTTAGSVATVIIGGSIAASFTPPANQSVSGTVQVDVRGSVAVAIISGSIAASFTPPANQSVSGTVNIGTGGPVSVLGTMSVLGTVPVTQSGLWYSSVLIASVVGAIPVTGFPTSQNVSGSVVAFQGTSPWVVNFQNSSILAVPVGSTIALWQSPSIVGTYAEDATAAAGDKGIFMLGVRNDTMSSVTSNDGDYGAWSIGPSGEGIVANAPLTKWIQGTGDFRQGNTGGSIVVIAAQGASIFTYITGLQVVNMGSASVLVTLAGTGSTLGYTIAPAGGGSNIYYPNGLKGPANGTFAASLSGIASVLVSAQGFTAKT